DVVEHALLLLARHERAHLGARVEPRTQADAARRGADALDDPVEQLAVHVQAGARRAHLPRVEEDRLRRARGRGLRIRVGQHDHRGLAAELERDALQRLRRRDVDLLTDLGRARERDLVDAGMRHERGAGRLAVARHDVDDAGRKTGLLDQLAEPKRAQRRLLGGLQHARAAGRERRAELPCRHREREVPRDDLPDDADRLAAGVRLERAAAAAADRDVDRRAFDLRRPARHVAEIVAAAWDVDDARHDLRLAVVDALELGELVRMTVYQVGELPDQRLALRRQELAPRAAVERAPGRL